MVNNKQSTDELNMSIFLSRCNHSVNALIVTLITQTRSLYLFCSFQIARFQISSSVTMARAAIFLNDTKNTVGLGGDGAKLYTYLFLVKSN